MNVGIKGSVNKYVPYLEKNLQSLKSMGLIIKRIPINHWKNRKWVKDEYRAQKEKPGWFKLMRLSPSPIIRDITVKTTVLCHLIPTQLQVVNKLGETGNPHA